MTARAPRRRVRFAIVAVVCLLLGAVTTVGVAWGAAQPDRLVPEVITLVADLPPASDLFEQPVFSRRTPLSRAIVAGATWEHAAQPMDPWLGADGYDLARMLDAGWPLVAVRSVRVYPWLGTPTPSNAWTFLSWHEGLAAPAWWQGGQDCLPIQPIWPGFAIDTGLYAFAWYLVIVTPFAIIRTGLRRFRVSRGMCGSCG